MIVVRGWANRAGGKRRRFSKGIQWALKVDSVSIAGPVSKDPGGESARDSVSRAAAGPTGGRQPALGSRPSNAGGSGRPGPARPGNQP